MSNPENREKGISDRIEEITIGVEEFVRENKGRAVILALAGLLALTMPSTRTVETDTSVVKGRGFGLFGFLSPSVTEVAEYRKGRPHKEGRAEYRVTFGAHSPYNRLHISLPGAWGIYEKDFYEHDHPNNHEHYGYAYKRAVHLAKKANMRVPKYPFNKKD
ncbi:MAG: hypothetical protein ABH849_02980 [Nanoarchaeota archaeon]